MGTKPRSDTTGGFLTGGDWTIGLNRASVDGFGHAEILANLGDHLRRCYGSLVQEPVPEDMAKLVRRLEARTSRA